MFFKGSRVEGVVESLHFCGTETRTTAQLLLTRLQNVLQGAESGSECQHVRPVHPANLRQSMRDSCRVVFHRVTVLVTQKQVVRLILIHLERFEVPCTLLVAPTTEQSEV